MLFAFQKQQPRCIYPIWVERHLVGLVKAALLPQLLAIDVENEGNRHQQQGDEAQKRVTPAELELALVQIEGAKREEGAQERAEDGKRGGDTGGVRQEGLEQVRLDGHHDAHDGGTEDKNTDHGHDPVDMLLDGPAVNEETGAEEQAAGNGEVREQADLGAVDEALGGAVLDDLVGQEARDADADEHADAGGQVGETDGVDAEAVVAGVHKGEGGEQHVQDAVGDGDVERHEGDDGLEDEQLHGAVDGGLEGLGGRLVAGQLGAQVGVAGLLAEASRLALEQDGRVGLAQAEEGERDKAAADDDDQPKDPAPAGRLNEVATGDGTDAGAEKGAESPGRHGLAAVLHLHAVGDGAGADGDGHGSGETHEETESEEHAGVRAEGSTDGENGEEDVANVVQGRTAVHLTERSDQEGTEGEAENVDGY